jgi:Tol biopolymer transport system component
LKLTGLVRPASDGTLEVRNRIYSTVFDANWVKRSLPASRARQTVLVASLLAVVAFIIAGYALYQRQIQPSLTYVEQFQTSNSPDVKLTSLARLLELDERSNAQAHDLYSELTHEEKLGLFSGLSDPQNIAAELVTVIESVYQLNENTAEGNELLGEMRSVLGQIGASGAPSLKTEIEFWLKGRTEANQNQNALTAASFYDSALTESIARGYPNNSVRLDRALVVIVLEDYESALNDLQVVWDEVPDRRAEVTTVIQRSPGLAAYILEHPMDNAAFLPLVTPEALASATGGILTPSADAPLTATTTAKNPAPSPYDDWIAFGYGVDNSREIMIMHPSAGSQRQITNNGSLEEAPSFSPENWSLVYASYRTQGGWELYIYDLHRGTEQQITAFEGEAHFPVWSPVPDDTRIIFEGRTSDPRATNVWMVAVSTGELTQLTHGGADTRPSWSPDGRRVLFGRPSVDTSRDGFVTVSDEADIFILDLATNVETNLTNTPESGEFNFAWSPDGQEIVYTSTRRDVNGDGSINLNDSENLFLIPADGGPEQLLNLRGRTVFSPSWSPDGRYILMLAVEGDGENTIWRYDTETEDFVRITEPGPYFHPRYANGP